MYNFYVYLIIAENRLVITQAKNKFAGHCELVSFTSRLYESGMQLAQTYCMGYIMGTNIGHVPINNMSEFSF